MPSITHVTVRNGLTLMYVTSLVNVSLQLLASFGVHLTNTQTALITTFVNIAILLAARVLHLPERTADGGTVKVGHVPVLETMPPHEPPETQPAVVMPPALTPPPAPPLA